MPATPCNALQCHDENKSDCLESANARIHVGLSGVFAVVGVEESERPNVKEHAPPLARASVETGVEVHTTGDVSDRAAGGGCCASSCWASSIMPWSHDS